MRVLVRGGWALAMLGAAVVGCGSGGSGADPQLEQSCGDPIETRSLAWSERSPLGFSADELLAALGAEHRGRLTYEDGSTTSLELELERASGSVAFERYGAGPAPASTSAADVYRLDGGCPDGLTIPATLSVGTSDGAFAEAWPVSLFAFKAGAALGTAAPVAIDALMGAYMPANVDPARADRLQAQLSVRFAGAEWSGSLSVVAIEGMTAPANGVASGERVDGATF